MKKDEKEKKMIEQKLRECIRLESRDFLDELLSYKPKPLTQKDWDFLNEINEQLNKNHSSHEKKIKK